MNWWLHAFYTWLKEVRYFWLTLFVLFISLLIILMPETNELRIRITGLTLQLFGMSTVVLGIRMTRQFFGHPGFIETAIQWLRRFPTRRPVITAEVAIEIPMPSLSAFAHQWTNPSDESPEARLTALEANLNIVNERVTQVHNLHDQDIRNIEHLLHLERITRENQNQEIRRTVELTETGGLTISLMGLVWLIFGIIMSTIPNEIANLLK